MTNYYIYGTEYKKNQNGELKNISCTVIFTEKTRIDAERLKAEITEFYSTHYQTDEILVITGAYAKEELLRVFKDNQVEVFKGIPKKQDINFSKSINLYTFDRR
ncbi:MAG: hypothetical protein WBG42_01425, partial [Cryomorphaceae bacterium]